jgi:hypothetical protein
MRRIAYDFLVFDLEYDVSTIQFTELQLVELCLTVVFCLDVHQILFDYFFIMNNTHSINLDGFDACLHFIYFN